MAGSAPARCLAFLVLLSSASGATAWGPFGHHLISELAQGMLTPGAASFYHEVLGDETLGAAAVWPDQMRSDPSPFWQEEAGPYHYVTVPDSRRYEDLPPLPQGDALIALARFEQMLVTDSASLQDQQLALRFSIHIIQDLHQPLHVGNGQDRGGTRYFVRFGGKVLNLHRIWDTEMITEMRRTQSEWVERLAGHAVLAQSRAEDLDAHVWVAESQALRGEIYPQGKTLDESYLHRYQEVLEERLALAASRTAAWLDALAKRTRVD